jgi:hypothetical protein
MIKNHSHGVFKIFELFGVDTLDVRILDFVILHQGEQDVCGQVLALQVEALGYLALLQ